MSFGPDVCSGVELRLYDSTFTRIEASIPEARSITFTTVVGEDGGLSFTIPKTAPALVADPTVLNRGFITVAIVLQAGQAPTEVLAFEMVRPRKTVISDDGVEMWEVTCPGARHVLEYGVLWPERRTSWDTNSEDTRFFGWMSIDSAAWYDGSDWTTPLTYGAVGPSKWDYPSAQKITADLTPADGDVNLFRAEFTLLSAATVRIVWLCKATGTLWVDSEQVNVCSSTGAVTQVVYLTLAAGGHTIAAEVTQPNSAYQLELAVNVSLSKGDATPGATRLQSDTTHWKVHKVVGGAKPGWTVGGMLTKLLLEGQNTSLQNVTDLLPLVADFDHTVDSLGNVLVEQPETGWLTGQTSLLNIVSELQETTPCAVRVRPISGALTLQLFTDIGSDLTASVFLKPRVGVLRLEVSPQPVIATKALVRSQSRWLLVEDSSAVAEWGRRYKGVTAGTTSNPAKASQIGSAALAKWSDPPTPYSVEIVARNGCIPFYSGAGGFDEGDTVSVPDGSGWVGLQVVAITGSTPADMPGPVVFTVELVEP